MKELIKIEEKDGKQLVSARELHEFLQVRHFDEGKQKEVGSRFNDWIKNRIDKYMFEDGIDYTKVLVQCIRGQNECDYAITIDMAKELCMVENNELGRKARKYFIECEKQLYKITHEQRLAISLYEGGENAILAHKELLEMKMKPLQEEIGTLLETENSISMLEFAKIIGIGRTTLFKILRDMKILNKDNIPYETYNKYFSVDNVVKGSKTYPTTRITSLWQDYVYKKLKDNGYL